MTTPPVTMFVVVPWHNENQIQAFLSAWCVDKLPDWLVLQQDKVKKGCGATKNAGIAEALRRGAEAVWVIDDDCYPASGETPDLGLHAEMFYHELAGVAWVSKFKAVTDPPSRGTPYRELGQEMPVAAMMGFWELVPDYDAIQQLVHGPDRPMKFSTEAIHGQYFPLCGMNLAFRPRDWLPWCQFIEVPRFDDIWMGWLWQREAYRRGCCFDLSGPIVRHSRQSNVWQNLRDEAKHLEANETLWRKIAAHPADDYESLRKLLPV